MKNKNQKKAPILIASFHTWETVRPAGMHRLARSFSKAGYNVDFLTFPFTWYHPFKFNEQFNFKNFFKLLKGTVYKVEGKTIKNFLVVSLYTFSRVDKFLPKKIPIFSTNCTIPKLKLDQYEIIVLESNPSVLLIDRLINKNKKIIYRASDLLDDMYTKNPILIDYEGKVINNSDLVLVPNISIKQKIFKKFPLIKNKIILWKNGFDKELFDACNLNPYRLGTKNVININASCMINWDCIIKCTESFPNINFHIIGPNLASKKTQLKINKYKNFIYYGGLEPKKTVGYIKFADLAFLPYSFDDKFQYLELTSTMYQYMYSGLPVISFSHGALKKLKDYGFFIGKNIEEFIELIEVSICRNIDYTRKINFEELSWENRISELTSLFKKYNII